MSTATRATLFQASTVDSTPDRSAIGFVRQTSRLIRSPGQGGLLLIMPYYWEKPKLLVEHEPRHEPR